MNNEYYTELQRRTNVDLDLIWASSIDYPKQLESVLASGNLPEVLVSNAPNDPSLIKALKKGMFWDLTSFLGDFSEYPNLKQNATPGVFNYVKWQGGIYAIPRSRSLVDEGIKIRKDWLDGLGVPVPQTLDEYVNVLKKIVEMDPDGNGKKDTIGLADKPFSAPFMSAFGLNNLTYNEEGGLVKDILTPQAVELVGWFSQLYERGLLAPNYDLIKKTYAQELLLKGRVASFTGSIYYDYNWGQLLKSDQPDAELITLPAMTGPHGNTAYLQKGYTGAFYISRKVPEEKVRQILAYFNQTASLELTDYAYYGISGVHHTIENGEPLLTPLGQQQLSVNALQPLVTAFKPWVKVQNWAAPKAYNDAKVREVATYEKQGKQNPFDWLVSEAWSEVWPRYKDEFDRKVRDAVTGTITMQEFAAYVEQLRNDPEFKRAFLEFSRALESAHPIQ